MTIDPFGEELHEVARSLLESAWSGHRAKRRKNLGAGLKAHHERGEVEAHQRDEQKCEDEGVDYESSQYTRRLEKDRCWREEEDLEPRYAGVDDVLDAEESGSAGVETRAGSR